MVCPTVRVEARLDYKYKSLKKHLAIVEDLKSDIKVLETERRFVYFHLMGGGKGVY